MIRAQGGYVVVQPTNVRMEALGVNPVSVDVAPIVAQSVVLGFELRVFRKERLVLRGEFLVRHGRLAPSLTAAKATRTHPAHRRPVGCQLDRLFLRSRLHRFAVSAQSRGVSAQLLEVIRSIKLGCFGRKCAFC
jgi:hypothetical protein